MNSGFEKAFAYKVIYVFGINDEAHKGLLKIGDATLNTSESIDNLPPNCKALNQAARDRIREYTNTAGIEFDLKHTELAVRVIINEDGGQLLKAFRDHDVHSVLENSNIPKKKIKGTTGKEWFEVDLETAKAAIKAVKDMRHNLSGTNTTVQTPIVLRPEQIEAIDKTCKQYKTGNKMLWNAKMRFGKTLSALQVVKNCGFKKTIIITHRPVVDKGWYEDFNKIFDKTDGYIYGSKSSGYDVDGLLKSGKNFVYFASMQDLRGSKEAGGKFEKNETIFDTKWDFVIVDEAHEGTTTALGDEVIKKVVKETTSNNTKFLALSGTPFNILKDYDDNIYTWDYVMEQQRKNEWDKEHFGDSNPYEELPELKIYTYNLGDLLKTQYIELEDKAFNFREFFRVWTGDLKYDKKPLPDGTHEGDFYHRDDVWSFLNLITKEDEQSCYPFSNNEYRDLFRHTLWMVPGVKEARALKKLMMQHPVFGNGSFDIVNVAGVGDEEEKSTEALKKVTEAIANAEKESSPEQYTITLSCGKLTTGVTVREWTAVFMLAGSFSTSAANYLQTIFRVQSPCNKDGRIKECCYVFDFAPDRTLKMVAESVALSTKAGKTNESDKRILGEFLNYCPVIAVSGTVMKKYDTNKLLQQLKRAYAERAVQNGFDDTNLYNDELLKLNDIDLERFNTLKGIIGKSKASPKSKDIDVNNQGFTDEEYEELNRLEKKQKKQRTPEEQQRLEELKERNKNRNNAISILRGISIRMPLLIYGADVDIGEDLTLDKFLDDKVVDPASWEEFMPTGVTKEVFKDFIKYYDPEIFIAAGRRIRNIVKGADELLPTERVKKIAELFACFKNPDKETVLTPWRVVNMHMSDCLGGYDFYDEAHTQMQDKPRFVSHGQVTEDTFANKDAQILEINSKTGLYPLYVTYSIFRAKMNDLSGDISAEQELELWRETIKDNVFVICKTPMAKQITKRTLLGYKAGEVNAHYFDDLINMLQNKPEQFTDKVLRPSYWKKKGDKMQFDAVVGNPPYQLQGGSGGNNDAPIYQHFASAISNLNPTYTSLIIPSRWFSTGRENLLGEFRRNMLTNKSLKTLVAFASSRDIFTSVEIKGGICYYLIDNNYSGKCLYSLVHDGLRESSMINLDDFDIFVREPHTAEIVSKILAFTGKEVDMVDTIVSSDTPFGISSNPRTSKKNPMAVYETETTEHNTKLFHIEKQKRKVEFIERALIVKNTDAIDKHKVFIPGAGGSGNDASVLGKPEYAAPNSVCSQSYLFAAFASENEAKNFIKYLGTKLFRLLVSASKISQQASNRVYRFVPLQDFTANSDIYWDLSIPDIDKQLYKKYNLTEEDISYIDKKIKYIF